MSNMIRPLLFALTLGMAAASGFEWKGIFYTKEATYKWGAEKVDGQYADPSMKLVAIPTATADKAALTSATSKGTAAMALTCEEVQSEGTIKPAENKCFKLVFDATKSGSKFTVDASGTEAIAFFAEHFPTEFEATEHYFKDTTGVDIEPVAQEPEPAADGHSHSHGGGTDFSGWCVCQAQSNNWKLDCTAKALIETAVSNLDANTACKAANPPKTCIDNYYVMQAHHDHCLHDQLPTGIEKTLHDYEQYYTDCFVKRQYNAALSNCPEVDCTDQTALTTSISTLQGGTCNTTCSQKTCADAIKVVLMAHDVCPEDKLPNNLETALHDYEEACEAQLCNSAKAAFDPYNDPCSAEAGDGTTGEARSQAAFLVMTLLSCLAVCLF